MLTPAEIILDEFVRSPDPMPWYKASVARYTLEQNHGVFLDVLGREWVCRAGVARQVWEDGDRHSDVLYAPTPRGRAHWHKHVSGRRQARRNFPRFSTAQLTAAQSPVDVFDLARVPWRHKLTPKED
jgi:hypothetical protein